MADYFLGALTAVVAYQAYSAWKYRSWATVQMRRMGVAHQAHEAASNNNLRRIEHLCGEFDNLREEFNHFRGMVK